MGCRNPNVNLILGLAIILGKQLEAERKAAKHVIDCSMCRTLQNLRCIKITHLISQR